jgi:hypothetical protein
MLALVQLAIKYQSTADAGAMKETPSKKGKAPPKEIRPVCESTFPGQLKAIPRISSRTLSISLSNVAMNSPYSGGVRSCFLDWICRSGRLRLI